MHQTRYKGIDNTIVQLFFPTASVLITSGAGSHPAPSPGAPSPDND